MNEAVRRCRQHYIDTLKVYIGTLCDCRDPKLFEIVYMKLYRLVMLCLTLIREDRNESHMVINNRYIAKLVKEFSNDNEDCYDMARSAMQELEYLTEMACVDLGTKDDLFDYQSDTFYRDVTYLVTVIEHFLLSDSIIKKSSSF